MTRFESSLRRGLMDANLAQYERVLQDADAAQPDFSPSYLRERMRLLADPWGWMRRREAAGPRRRRRLDWRVIAIAAALLLLSACAYAAATGQFSQWFPRMGADPRDPEISEEVLSRTGTAIEQTQTVDGVTAALNAAVWDGNYLHLSLVVTAPGIPGEVTKDTSLYTEECSISMDEERWKEYVRKDEERFFSDMGDDSRDLLEQSIQNRLDMGQTGYWNHISLLNFPLVGREGDTLTFEAWMTFKDYLERPELKLRLKNIATYVDGKGDRVIWHDGKRTGPGPDVPILKGPIDFTFALENPILPLHYRGAVPITLNNVPFRFTGFEISVFEMDLDYEVTAPVEMLRAEEYDELERLGQLDPDKLYDRDVTRGLHQMIQGLWTGDGGYVDLSQRGGGSSVLTSPDGTCDGSVNVSFPHPIDPAAVTAVNLNGARVELRELEHLDG